MTSKLRHLPGKCMVVADALSRLHAKKATPFAGVCAVGLSMLQPQEQPFVGATAPKVLRPPVPKGLDPDFVAEDGRLGSSRLSGRMAMSHGSRGLPFARIRLSMLISRSIHISS